ncbi:MAG: elongation factor T [Parcubacteria group bacterium Gr01-1014_38]|nr:MAG: elongation factor T [Parcubacteria group bacterium Gr01-1014_38]
MVTKELVQELRARTGAGMLDCRKALEEAQGNLERALQILQERGIAAAAAKASRAAAQGTVGAYVHTGGTIGALVLLRCETDFVAQTPVFLTLAKDLAMQVAAMHPDVIRSEEVAAGARPEEAALLAQPFVKDPAGRQTVGELIAAKVLELGENITVEKFIRFAV